MTWPGNMHAKWYELLTPAITKLGHKICDMCLTVSNKMVCHHCGHEITRQDFDDDNYGGLSKHCEWTTTDQVER